MTAKQKLSFIGGDKRQCYMIENLSEMGYEICIYGLEMTEHLTNVTNASSMKEAIEFGDVIIGPVPFSKNHVTIHADASQKDLNIKDALSFLDSSKILAGGCLGLGVTNYCEKQNIPTIDLMKFDEVSIRNSVATAEGALAEAILRSTVNLHKSFCLVLGYGKCASVLAQKLKGLDAYVTVCARKTEALESAAAFGFETIPLNELKAHISKYTFVFNTIPAFILDKAVLTQVSANTTIIDIASSPGGIDLDAAKELGVNSALCLGLPGKYAPKTSADILTDALLAHL